MERRPPKRMPCGGATGNEYWGIPLPARHYLVEDGSIRRVLGSLDYLAHCESASVTQVECVRPRHASHILQRAHMGFCQVVHMHVIPHACTIWGQIVSTENLDLRSITQGLAQHVGNQVCFRVV